MIKFKDKAIKDNNTSVEEVLYLLLLNTNINIDSDVKDIHNKLVSQGYITAKRDDSMNLSGQWALTSKAYTLITEVIVNSDEKITSREEMWENLATKLKALFPEGKRPGTNYYWAEGKSLIIKRLKLFFKKYESDLKDIYESRNEQYDDWNTFISDKIIEATEKYIEGFNGNYTWMKTLKYFLFQEKLNANREVESASELINYLENNNQKTVSSEWTARVL
jgi:hypothetical protein